MGTCAGRVVQAGIAAVVVGVLISSPTGPIAAAAAHGGPAQPAEPGGFAVGDGAEGLIDPRDGGLSFTLPLGGVELSWDSRRLGADRLGFGDGWATPLAAVDTEGGVRVVPRSGRVYEMDAADASGLLGYDGDDVRFEAGEVPVPPRAEGASASPTSAAYTLHELGGVRTLFDADGDPLARVETSGSRTDWEWDADVPHRVRRIVDAHGVVTELDWRAERDTVVVRAGTNLPGAAGREWRVERGRQGEVAAIVDPLDGRFEIRSRDGLVTALRGPSGATTEIEWHSAADGRPRVARVRTVDADGDELGVREWAATGEASSWPVMAAESTIGRATAGAANSETVLGDGTSRVHSMYDGAHRLRSRSVRVMTASGEREMQHQRLDYPADDSSRGGPEAWPDGWSRPIAATLTHRGLDGSTRSVTERTLSDASGRTVERTSSDGAVTRVSYDEQVPAGAQVPVGLPTREVVTTTDGLMRETEHTLNPERTAVVATETRSGSAATMGRPEALTVTGRTERVVRADGFVTEHRVLPGADAQARPIVITRTEHTDLVRGTSTVTETGPAPTGAEVAAGQVGTATTSTTTSLLHGGVLEQTDVTGRSASAGYDVLGRRLTVANPAGQTMTTAYETTQREGRNATVVSLPGGVVVTEVRDELGRVIAATDNVRDGVATPGFTRVAEARVYPSPGVMRVTDAWGGTTETTTDVYGRVIRVESPTGLVQVTDYDDVAGTVTTGVTPTGRLADAELVTTKRADEADRLSTISASRADGVPTPDVMGRFDGFGRPVLTEDGRAVTDVAYDPSGNPIRTTTTPRNGGGTVTTERRFDAFGTSLEKRIADGEWSATGGRRETDVLGRVIAETDQRGGMRTLHSSIDGLPERVVGSAGQLSESRFDPRTRQLTRTTVTSPAGPSVSTAYEYDETTGRVRAVFDPADAKGSRIEYSYDDFGNALETRYPDGAVISREYDEHGRLRATMDAAGRTTVRRHDATGRLAEVVQHDGETDASVLARAAYHYDAFDRVDRLESGNGVLTAYTFTSASEIASETTTRGDELLAEREYLYDDAGRLVRRVDRLPGPEPGASSLTSTAYRYDGAGRLIRSTVEEGTDEGGSLLRSRPGGHPTDRSSRARASSNTRPPASSSPSRQTASAPPRSTTAPATSCTRPTARPRRTMRRTGRACIRRPTAAPVRRRTGPTVRAGRSPRSS
jgi:YD repeat-containing protein